MFSPNKLTLAIFSVLASPHLAFADQTATELPKVEVTAPASSEESQETTISAQELQTTGNTETGSALRQIPSVDASRMGGHGVDINVRGQMHTQLNVLLDGAKIEGGCPNHMDPPTSYAEISSYDEVVVIKGVNSVVYGSGGSGGTVLFERSTPNPEQPGVSGEINLGKATNGLYQDINGTIQAVNDKGFVVLQGSDKKASSYKDGNGEIVPSSYTSQQGHIDLGWTPDQDNLVKFSYERSVIDDALFAGAKMDAPKSDGKTARLQYRGENLSPSINNIDVDIYRSTVDHLMNNYELRTLPEGGMTMETATDVTTQGAKVKLSSMVGHTKLDYGVQVENVSKMATLSNPTAGKSIWYMWPDAEMQTNSVFAESTSYFKDDQKVIMGLRYDRVKSQAHDADTATDLGNTASDLYAATYEDYSGDNSNTQGNLNALIRYERQYNKHGSMFVGVSRTHRYADATEMFIAKGGKDVNSDGEADGGWVGNPDLEAEQHNQLDIGYATTGQEFNWTVSAFYDRANDYILSDLSQNQDGISGTNNTIYVNKDARIYGAETGFDWQLTPTVKVGANIAMTRGENLTDDRNLSNIAPLSGSSFAELKEGPFAFGVQLSFAAKQTYVNEEIGEMETAAWNQLDFYGSYQMYKNVKVSAGIDNLGDRAYQNYLNRVDVLTGSTYKVYEPGATLWAKLNIKF